MKSRMLLGTISIVMGILLFPGFHGARAQQYLTTGNASVMAEVSHDGWGLITIYRPGSTPEESGITYPDKSYLTVLVNGIYYTNNPNLPDTAPPAMPAAPVVLDSGTDQILSGSNGADTIETTWPSDSGFAIVQDVYPVLFPNGGHIVIRVRVENHSSVPITAQAQYLLDVDIISSPSMANDNAKIATPDGYWTQWWSFPDSLTHRVPPFYMTVEKDLTDPNFPGEIATGFLSDSFAPINMGLIPPVSVMFVSWDDIVQNYTWGWDWQMEGRPFNDEAILLEWHSATIQPASAGFDSVVELARTSYGFGGYSTCTGSIQAYTFYKYDSHLTAFPVTSLLFNPVTGATLQQVKATQLVDSSFKILSPTPLYGDSSRQTQTVQPPNMASATEAVATWTDTIVRPEPHTISELNLDVVHGPGPDTDINTCGMPIVPLRQADVRAPIVSVVSRSGSFDGSLCNTRCTDFVTIDSGEDQTGIFFINPGPMQNMQLSIAGKDTLGGYEKYFSVCVLDSMQDGSGTVYCIDGAGNADSVRVSYCTIPDTLAPLITTTNGNAALTISIRDDRPWDRGLSSIRVIGDSNLSTSISPSNYHGLTSAVLTAYVTDTTMPSGLCIEVYDQAGNKHDTCFTLPAGVKQAVSTNNEAHGPMLSVIPESSVSAERIIISQAGGYPAKVKIFDILGRAVAEFRVTDSYEWYTGSFPSGTYMVQADVGGTVLLKKIEF